jgi:predicted permease
VRGALLLAARDFPRIDDVRIDGRALAIAAAAALFTALASGLAPALRGARFDLAASLHGGDGATAGGFRGARAGRLRDALLAAEAAFAVLLLIGATLLGRSFVRLVQVDAGYSAAHVLTAQIYIPGPSTPEHGDLATAHALQLRERLRSMPGVLAAGVANMMPLDNATMLSSFPAPGQPADNPKIARALYYVVSPGYAEAMGLRLRAGRLFTDADLGTGIYPWLVNEEFARLYLPARPIGLRWTIPATATSPPRTNEIIGIVANVLKNGNDARPQAEDYLLARGPARLTGGFEVAVKTAGDPSALAAVLRAAIQEIEPAAAFEITTMTERVSESMNQPRFAMTILVTFAVLALALASLGLHGVLSYGVSQRRRELGVRAALGATRRDLIGLVVREGLTVTAIGLAAGLCAAAALTRLMQGVLFGVAPIDPLSFAAAPLILAIVATAACLLPASRAASIDPSEALRSE